MALRLRTTGTDRSFQKKESELTVTAYATAAPSGAVFVYADSPFSAENARSTKINEGPLSLIFSMPENIVQGRLMIVSSCYL